MADIDRDFKDWEKQPHLCPECSALTANMGKDFESPKKTDTKAWNHLKSLYTADITFHSCGCSGPGYIPKNQQALIAFLEEKKQTYVANLRFWTTRTAPKNQSETNRDWATNSAFLRELPAAYTSGTKKQRKTDAKKAVAYWKEKITAIDEKISLSKGNSIDQ